MQRTPAEEYKHKLQSTRAEQRVLQRLEWRWERSLVLWTKSATKVQAGYRGMKSRQYFRQIKHELYVAYEQRKGRALALEKHAEGLSDEAVRILVEVSVQTVDLLVLRCRILYQLKRFHECDATARIVIGNTWH